jgi:hypothetical protein
MSPMLNKPGRYTNKQLYLQCRIFIPMFNRNKIILLLFTCMLCCIGINAQLSNDIKDSYGTFIEQQPSGRQQYYLACLPAGKERKLLQQNKAVQFHRQLNDTVFIVSFMEAAIQTTVKQYCRWIYEANSNWKLSPALLQQQNSMVYPSGLLLSVYTADQFINSMKAAHISAKATSAANTFIVTISSTQQMKQWLQDDNVYFIAAYHTRPVEELQINTLDLSVNKINQLHSRLPQLNGEGIVLSIKENLPDTTDIDFAERHVYNPVQAAAVTEHASIMATMAAGAGNSWYLGKGVASAAAITGSDFSNLLPDAAANYRQYHIAVQNHSYGVGIENFYGADAAAFDASAFNNDSLLFVFSAGNSGMQPALTGNYAGLPAVANLTGSFKMAKNIITVGAVDSFANVAPASSRGPAFDGRVKPELVAYGEDGTSGAAALVSGTAAVLHQAYQSIHDDSLASAALIKALLINSADDVGAQGIDYTAGYGNLNALKATEHLLQSDFLKGTVANGTSKTFTISIPSNIKKAKFTLVWTDPPATANAFRAMVNDLDLELQLPATTQSWKPWVLNGFANKDSLSAEPVRKRDSLNTVEQITIDYPAAGSYQLQVNGFDVSSSSQQFYIAYQFDTTDIFSWTFPAAADNIFPGAANIIRWTADTVVANATLYYSINNGSSWQLVDNAVNSGKKYYYWHAPDTNAIALLKMQIGTMAFVGDTFSISKKLDFKTGFVCNDAVLWYWNHLPGINQYQLFALTGKQLQPVAIVTDTQFVFDKNVLPYQAFAVAPIINGRLGVKSYTSNYTVQGVDCYVSNLIADLVNNNSAAIQFTLGTTYLVKRIVFEKLQAGNFVVLNEVTAINGLQYSVTDSQLQKGVNVYRVRIELQDGQVIYSFTTAVFYFANEAVIAYPNPVQQGHILTIQMSTLQNQQISIVDVTGRRVLHQTATDLMMQLPCNFARGLYFVTVTDTENKQVNRFRLLVH